MFVAPDHQRDPVRDHRLMHTVLTTTTLITILVHNKDVEVRVVIVGRSHETHLPIFPHTIKALITYCSDSVQSHDDPLLFDQHWTNIYNIHSIRFTQIIHQVSTCENIQSREGITSCTLT